MMDVYEPANEYWELNLGRMQEQQMFLTIDPSLQPFEFVCFLKNRLEFSGESLLFYLFS